VFLIVLLVVGLVGILAALVETVRLDGYGHRPPPRSHRHELDDDLWAELR
jgi:hypothetical protein